MDNRIEVDDRIERRKSLIDQLHYLFVKNGVSDFLTTSRIYPLYSHSAVQNYRNRTVCLVDCLLPPISAPLESFIE